MATRKEQRQQAKRKERERRITVKSQTERVSEKLQIALDDVDDRLLHRGGETARRILEELDERWPNNPEVLSRLVQVYQRLGCVAEMEATAERWARLAPHDPDVIAQRCWCLGMAGVPGLAAQAMRRFLDRWPNHPKSAGLRDILSMCEKQVVENLRTMKLDNDDRGRQALEAHERVFQAMQRGEFERVILLGEAALQQHPPLSGIFNNLAEAYFHAARLLDAVNASRRAAEIQPDNLITQFNVVRFSLLLGHRDEANQTADRIRSLRPDRFDFWSKLVSAFVLLERYDEALQAGDDARTYGDPRAWETPDAAELHHAIAVALAHRGRASEAESHWRSALKVRPGFAWASANLADLQRPVGERNGAFLFPVESLLPRALLDRLAQSLDKLGKNVSNDVHRSAVRQFCESCPGLLTAVPVMLRIGDEHARRAAVKFARLIGTPETLGALREFALSDRGSDATRIDAITQLRDVGAEITAPIRFFSKGKWTEIETLGLEITGEPRVSIPASVIPQMEHGRAALTAGDFRAAERFFREVTSREPTFLSAHNNLATALLSQERWADAENVLRQVLTLDETNIIARSNLAHLAIFRNNLDEAADWLKPLRTSLKMHTSEFIAMTGVDFELAMRRGHFDVARGLLKSIERVYPAYPNLIKFRAQLRLAETHAESVGSEEDA